MIMKRMLNRMLRFYKIKASSFFRRVTRPLKKTMRDEAAEKNDAGRVAPIRDCVWWYHLVVAFNAYGTFTILQKLYLPSILHLTLTRFNSLIVNILLSVRCYQYHLHATYTTLTLPHDTSTGEQYHGIGEQKSLLLRQISLCPCGVLSTAYVHVDCAAAG